MQVLSSFTSQQHRVPNIVINPDHLPKRQRCSISWRVFSRLHWTVPTSQVWGVGGPLSRARPPPGHLVPPLGSHLTAVNSVDEQDQEEYFHSDQPSPPSELIIGQVSPSGVITADWAECHTDNVYCPLEEEHLTPRTLRIKEMLEKYFPSVGNEVSKYVPIIMTAAANLLLGRISCYSLPLLGINNKWWISFLDLVQDYKLLLQPSCNPWPSWEMIQMMYCLARGGVTQGD